LDSPILSWLIFWDHPVYLNVRTTFLSYTVNSRFLPTETHDARFTKQNIERWPTVAILKPSYQIQGLLQWANFG